MTAAEIGAQVVLWLVALGGVGGRALAVERLREVLGSRWRLDPAPAGQAELGGGHPAGAGAEPGATDAPAASDFVSVLVPARDEAAVIDRLLDTLDAQDHPRMEVIVVDDHSTDDTAARARRHRCTVVAGAPLPDGWTGKCWALHQAAQVARGDILLFVDADTWHAPAAVRTVATQMRELDQLVVLGGQQVVTPAERLVPLLFWSLALSLVDFARAADPRYPDDVLGNGQFAAFRRGPYLAAGGHAAVRDRIVEDVALSRAVKRAGARTAMRVGPALTRTRMYTGWASVWRGFSKNAAVIDPGRPGLTIALTLVGALLVAQAELWPYVALGLSRPLAAVGVVQLALVLRGRSLVLREICGRRIGALDVLGQPLGAAVGIACMLNALRLGLGGGATWKGRRVAGRSL